MIATLSGGIGYGSACRTLTLKALHKRFEITLGMLTGRADGGSISALMNIPAITANPLNLFILFKYLTILNIFI